MRKSIHVCFVLDNNDSVPWNTRIEEAFNRCWNFCRELYSGHYDRSERKAFNRIIQKGQEFSLDDVWNLYEYSMRVHRRALKAAETQTEPMMSSIRQAADNLVTVMIEFKKVIEKEWNNK